MKFNICYAPMFTSYLSFLAKRIIYVKFCSIHSFILNFKV